MSSAVRGVWSKNDARQLPRIAVHAGLQRRRRSAGPLVDSQHAERGRIFRRGGWYDARRVYVPVSLSRINGPEGPHRACLTGQREDEVDSTGCLAVALSAGIILTTIHTQDYKDVRGDAAAGRITLPIAYPVLSRVVTAFILLAWSWGISLTWRLDNITAAAMGVLALIVGVSFVARRDTRADLISSHLYNVSQKHIENSDAVSHLRSLLGVALCRIHAPWILQTALGIMTGLASCFGPLTVANVGLAAAFYGTLLIVDADGQFCRLHLPHYTRCDARAGPACLLMGSILQIMLNDF